MKDQFSFTINLAEQFDELKSQIPDLVKSSVERALEEHLKVTTEKPLSASDIAQELSVSRVTISKWVKEGNIPSKVIGGRRYFLLSEVMKYSPKTTKK